MMLELIPDGLLRHIASHLGRPDEVGRLRGACRALATCCLEAPLALRFEGRRQDWDAVSEYWCAGFRLVAARLKHSNAGDAAVDRFAQQVRELVVSKCFALSSDCLARAAAANLDALHLGDLFNNTVARIASPTLRVVGLTNSLVSCDLVEAVLELPLLRIVFLGGTFSNCGQTRALARRRDVWVETTSTAATVASAVVAFDCLDLGESPLAVLEAARGLVPTAVFSAATEAADRRKQTPLHRAAVRDDAARVHFLIDAGADDRGRDARGATPLLRACESGALSALDALLAAPFPPLDLGDHRNETPLNVASLKGHANCVKRVLEAETDAPLLLLRADKEGFTPLHAAVVGRHLDVVKLLLDAAADNELNAQNRYGQSALHLAARAGEADLLAAILARGPILDVKDDRGWTPLDTCLAFQQRTRDAGVLSAAKLKAAGAKFSAHPRRKHHRRPAPNTASIHQPPPPRRLPRPRPIEPYFYL